MNIKNITLAILLCLGFGSAMAQETYTSTGRPVNAERKQYKKKGFDASRIVWGGGLGLSFGSVTDVSVSPIIGYRISDKFAAGVGFGYEYLRIKDYYELTDPNNTNEYIYKPLSASIYSPSVWARYRFFRNLFAELEYEHNFMTSTDYQAVYSSTTVSNFDFVKQTAKRNVPCLLLGIGLRQPISDRVSLLLLGMYDVLQEKYSPYRNTLVIRFGVAVGF